MKMKQLSLLVSLAIFSLANFGSAQTLFWDGGASNIGTDGDGISDGADGTWDNTVQNWDQGASAHTAWISGADASFGLSGIAPGAGLVTLGAPITANSLTISATNYIFTDGGNPANTLTVNSITNSRHSTISNNIINSTTLTKAGGGDLILTAASAGLTGALAVNAGVLQLGDAGVNNGPAGFSSAAVATNAILKLRVGTSATYAQTISGEGSVSIQNANSTIVTTLSGVNTHSGGTVVAQAKLSVSAIDETTSNALGTGPLQIGDNSSATVFSYAFPGGDVTTARPLVFGGTVNPTIENVSAGTLTIAGPISFAANATTSKTINLGGNIFGVFASTIADNGILPTSILKRDSGNWLLTGNNTFTGGVLFNGGGAGGILMLTNDTALGVANGSLIFTTNGSTSASSGNIASTNFPVTLPVTRTITFTGPNAAGMPTASFRTTDTNSLTIESYITGNGNVRRQSSSSSTTGPVRFTNDTNDYAGTFISNFGYTEFTSVANSGTPSSLGRGITNAGVITFANSASAARFSHIGAGNSTTTRALNWTATTGRLLLESSGAGTVQYLATTSLKSGAGSATLTLQGTNTGDNTLAHVVNNSSGTTTLTKEGTGKWILTAVNTYGGTTTISGGGTLQVSSDANLGTAPGAATPGFLILNNGILSASAGFTLNANRGIALGPTGTNLLGGNATSFGGLDVAAAQTLTYAGLMADRTSTNAGGLVKLGAGQLTLTGVNTYTGDTVIDEGTLALSGAGSIGSGTNLVIRNATFDVTGTAGFTVGAGRVLHATNGVTGVTATLAGSVNVSAGALVIGYTNGTPAINVTGGPLTLAAGTVTTLNVTNGGTLLPAGDYKIVSAGAGGSVAGAAPTALTVTGDVPNTATLNITGGELYLHVPMLYPPTLSSISLSGGSAVLNFSGTNGQTYQVLSSTNLSLPLTNWSPITSGTFSGSPVSYTNGAATEPQRFYIISSP